MTGELILHVTHISRTRMQACGENALSKGNNSEGVMTENKLIAY